jgi:hypothetical protein
MSCERFFIISTFSKAIEMSQIALFEKNFTNENFSFLLVFCTRKRHSTMIEDCIKKDDMIWCELNRLILIEIESRLHFLKFVVQTKKFFSDSFCIHEIDIQQWSKNYIERSDVIKCESDSAFIKKLIRYLTFIDCCRESVSLRR